MQAGLTACVPSTSHGWSGGASIPGPSIPIHRALSRRIPRQYRESLAEKAHILSLNPNRVRPWVRMFAAQADAGDPTGTGHGSALGQPTLNVFVAEVWQKSPAGVKL